MIPNRPAAFLIFPTATPLPKHSRWLRRTGLSSRTLPFMPGRTKMPSYCP